MPAPGTWISRLAAIALLSIALLLGYRFLVVPVKARYAANQQRIAQMSDLLQRYRDLEAARPALTDRLAALGRNEGEDSGYWEGESDVLTAAKLQDRAAQTVEAHGGNVISMQTADASDPEEALPVHRTVLSLRLATTIDGLAAVMHDMETAMPYMFIDRLVVTPQRRRSIGNAAEGAEQEPKLDVRLSVFGYARDRTPLPDEP